MTEVGQGQNSPSNTQREEQVGKAAGRLEEGETQRGIKEGFQVELY